MPFLLDRRRYAIFRPMITMERAVTLSTRSLVLCLGILAGLALMAQAGLGAPPLVLALSIIVAGAGLLAFFILGAYNVGAWLALVYVGGNLLIALYAKTLMRQTLDSHLYAPIASFSVLGISTLALLAAVLIAPRLDLGRPIFCGTTNTKVLVWLSWGCFLLGATFWFVNQHFQDPRGSGFGGFALLRDLLLMAVIARTAFILQSSGDRRTFDPQLALILGVSVFLGLLTNSKTYAAYPVVSYFATLIFFRRGLAVRHLVSLAVAVFLFVAVLTPLIQAWRYLGIQRIPAAARVAVIRHGLANLFAPGEFQQYAVLAALDFRSGYYNYFGGTGRGQMLLGRYASVQQIDPVIAQANSHGTMGGAAIWPAFTRQLPSILYPNKPRFSDAYSILVHFGLVDPAGGKFPTLPLAGQAFAGYGFPGVAVISFVVFLGLFIALKKFGWLLHRNVFAIFVFSEFVVVYGSQGDLAQYVGFILRALPVFTLIFWLLQLGPRLRMHRSSPARGSVEFTNNAKNAQS